MIDHKAWAAWIGTLPVENPLADDVFESRARQLFDYQYNEIETYRGYCDRQGVTPNTLETYLHIPCVPTDVFKRKKLFAGKTAERVFRTSGTTVGERGEHHFASTAVYETSLTAPFEHFVQHDFSGKTFVLIPPSEHLPDSSLSFMMSELADERWTFFYDAETNEFDFDGLAEALEKTDEPVCLIGTGFAFIYFLDSVDQSWSLPIGSRLMETGGLKGKTREVSRDEFYTLLEDRFSIERYDIVSEYSMTELSSQAYTPTLHGGDYDRFVSPPWARVHILDPFTFEEVDVGDQGIIVWFDLANIDSVSVVQTADMGTRHQDGFSLDGRAKGAVLRGCSLTVEEIVNG